MESNFNIENIFNQTNTDPDDMWTNFLKESKCGLRKLLPQSYPTTTTPINQTFPQTTQRKWKIIYTVPKILSDFTEDTPAFASIEVRTRNDEEGTVPERLYSSLKYEVTQEIPAHVLGSQTAVVMSKIQIVNPYNVDEEITKTNGKSIIKGTQDFIPLTINGTTSALYSKTKLQFTDVSYHHEKKYFSFKVSYYDPNNLNDPLFIQLSSPFQVFARRPRRKSLKRKTSSVTPLTKKVKAEKQKQEKQDHIVILDNGKKDLDQFLKTLDLLVSYKDKLSESDEKIAMDSIQKKLLHSNSTMLTDNLPDLDFFSLS